MFDVLSRGFEGAMLKLRGQARLTEENLAPALREVRASLLQADVQLDVVKDFLERVKTKSLGEIVPLKDPTGKMHKVSPEDWFIKACYDELVELMTSDDIELKLDGNPAVILMVGLQGSGKTTTTGKIARSSTTRAPTCGSSRPAPSCSSPASACPSTPCSSRAPRRACWSPRRWSSPAARSSGPTAAPRASRSSARILSPGSAGPGTSWPARATPCSAPIR
jgi:hypothetical protein